MCQARGVRTEALLPADISPYPLTYTRSPHQGGVAAVAMQKGKGSLRSPREG